MIEKRQHKRFQIPLPIAVKPLDVDAAEEQRMQLKDISIGGACFASKRPLSVGEEFEIRLQDTDSDFASSLGLVTDNSGPLSFTMHAKVLRSSANDEVAVEFCSPLRIAPLAA